MTKRKHKRITKPLTKKESLSIDENALSTQGDDEMSKDLTKYVTTLEAAGLLGVVPTSVNHLLKDGKIKGQKKGHYWLVYLPSIEKYISTKSPTGRPTSKLPQLKVQSENRQE